MQLGRELTEGVNAAVDVGVLAVVIMRLGLDDLLWFLRCGRVVEINERSLMASRAEDGEIGADLVWIERHNRCISRRRKNIGRGTIHILIVGRAVVRI